MAYPAVDFETEKERFKKRSLWPLVTTLALLALNPEFSFPNILLHWNWVPSFPVLTILDVTMGTLTLMFSYLYLDRVFPAASKAKPVRSLIGGNDILNIRLMIISFTQTIRTFIERLMAESEQNRNFFKMIWRVLQRGALIGMFLVPWGMAIPLFSWIWGAIAYFPLIIVCRKRNWPAGIIAMIVGDMVKNIFFCYVWWNWYHPHS